MNQQLSAVGLLTPSLTGSVEADLVFNDGVFGLRLNWVPSHELNWLL